MMSYSEYFANYSNKDLADIMRASKGKTQGEIINGWAGVASEEWKKFKAAYPHKSNPGDLHEALECIITSRFVELF